MSNLSYHIIRSKKRKKTISLCIRRGMEIVIYVPYNMPKNKIDKFFEEKKPWIYRKLSDIKMNIDRPKDFVSGEFFPYLGRSYQLKIQDSGYSKQPLLLFCNNFILDRTYKGSPKELFIQWYKKEARNKILERVHFFSRKLQLFPEGLKITSAEYRWGSCSARNILSFAWRLVMAPYPVIDYVVVHELLHIREKNHSHKFWRLLKAVIPDFQKHRQWLKDNGYALSL